MSTRIFEQNGLYVTSMTAPAGQGRVLEFDSHGARLNEIEVRLLLVALTAWISDCDARREHKRKEKEN